jgi:glycosyltransferase involved in cell wall biosynthesis
VSRVLLIAYHFPPEGGAGVQRSAKLATYLPHFGWEPVVITRSQAPDNRWNPRDATLAMEVPADVSVRRARSVSPSFSSGLRGRRERWLRFESPFAKWWRESAVALGEENAEGIQLIYASLSPWQSGEAAAQLSRRLGLPWVADLRDPWALDEMMVYPSRLHRRLECARMENVLSSADAIVMNTPEATRRLIETFPTLRGKHIATIPNGFDAEDFSMAAADRTDGKFRIVHTGYLHTALGRQLRRGRALRRLLGGAVPGVDIYTRSHVFLVQALERAFEADPSLRDVVTLQLAGVLSDSDLQAVRSDVVEVLGYLSHAKTVALMRTADLLFLPMQNLPLGVRATIVPGKTYEYLASGRPILAAVPDGDARDLLAEAGSAYLCRPDDVEAMQRIVVDQVARWASGTHAPEPDPQVVERYERRRLTAHLASVLDAVSADDASDRSESLAGPVT